MASHCRAVVFSGKGTHEIREFPVPDPPPDGALLRVEAVETVVVEGPGHQGLAVLEAVRAAGAGTVIVTGAGGDGLRLEAARALGASHIIDVDAEDPVERVGELTSGLMADVVMDIAPV